MSEKDLCKIHSFCIYLLDFFLFFGIWVYLPVWNKYVMKLIKKFCSFGETNLAAVLLSELLSAVSL